MLHMTCMHTKRTCILLYALDIAVRAAAAAHPSLLYSATVSVMQAGSTTHRRMTHDNATTCTANLWPQTNVALSVCPIMRAHTHIHTHTHTHTHAHTHIPLCIHSSAADNTGLVVSIEKVSTFSSSLHKQRHDQTGNG
jgi:hypothetical protein